MRRDAGAESSAAELGARLREVALEPPVSGGPAAFWGRAVLWVVLLYYGWYYVTLAVSR